MHFNKSSQPYLNDYYKCLPNESTQKDLGILVSADLQWSCHIQHVISKAYKVLGMLWRHFCSVIAIKAKRSLYLSLVCCHLLYCPPLWHPHLIVHIKSLESVQSRATKFILSDSTTSYRDRLVKLRLLPLMMELNYVILSS